MMGLSMKHKLLALLAALAVAATSVVALTVPASAHTDRDAAYVAFGDSFAAGTGVPAYATGDEAACLRSQRSGYPTLLSKSRTFRGLDDVTCSGATTVAIAGQLSSADIGPGTRSVTVTVGGNDIGWSQTLMGCMVNPAGCSAGLADVAARIPAVRSSIAGVVRAIAVEAPNAEIYVTGYPYLFGYFQGSCTVGTGPTGTPIVVDHTTATTVNSLILGLNAAIATGVAKSGEQDATYVNVAAFSLRHGLCGSGTDWINGVEFSGASPLPLSLHPNVAGEWAYAKRTLLASWWN